mmetsp:Transcript_110180/g.187677  ORF Transcript_110180/g.187677 Transcript_110180/m.187677 type:complete len:138 (-) Transcript_110180:742-1155(-)
MFPYYCTQGEVIEPIFDCFSLSVAHCQDMVTTKRDTVEHLPEPKRWRQSGRGSPILDLTLGPKQLSACQQLVKENVQEERPWSERCQSAHVHVTFCTMRNQGGWSHMPEGRTSGDFRVAPAEEWQRLVRGGVKKTNR